MGASLLALAKSILDSIAFRKHDTQRLFVSCAKKNSFLTYML